MAIKVTHSELEAFYRAVTELSVDLDGERDHLDEAAEAVGSPFGDSDLKNAIDYFHDDWNTARDDLITSLESVSDHAFTVAEGWRGIDEADLAELAAPPVCKAPE